MVEKILSLDRKLFVYLNGLGSESFDGLWLMITKQTSWIPLFIVILYIIFKKIGAKQTLILLLFVALLVTFTDQVANLFKNGFQRLRPCSEPDLKNSIRIVKSSATFSFVSGHATNSMGITTLLYLIFKNHFKYFGFLFLWPLIFAYSRIYLGLHYPLDIIGGYILGWVSGFMMFKIYQAAQIKYFPQ
ncbi:phosphatase PAP2 family protein [Flavobacterium psychrotolerans]|uniref:Phosphatase PAP2 family protein n=1 Tax=Flavobacterium psychrotolerans TaxID=2169410 RepID=A0A2U1JNG4_9FLAO|nr:phosphatase PAP2 family protein [Flavobacterium psychrotolerans]PWA06514.1 phosphatase PAP2 family protein [Flavobacterium psychrotolerans]